MPAMQSGQAEQIFDEFVRTTAGRPNDQSALHYKLLREKGPQQWPCPALGQSSERTRPYHRESCSCPSIGMNCHLPLHRLTR